MILALFKRAVVHPTVSNFRSLHNPPPLLLFSSLSLERVRYFRREHSILPIGNGGALVPRWLPSISNFSSWRKMKGDGMETGSVWDRIRIPHEKLNRWWSKLPVSCLISLPLPFYPSRTHVTFSMFFVKILWKADINRCACEGKFGGCLELRMMKFGWKLSFFF